MKRNRKAGLLLTVVVILGGVGLWAQAPAAPAGFHGWAVKELSDLETKLARLAEAVPQEKFTWRPGEGVRSVSEVYLHVAGGNFGIPTAIGAAPPAGIERRGLEKSTTEKAKVVSMVKQSFEHARQAVTNISDADLEKPVKLFGRDASYREVVLALVTHAHEHLGQSIAYARVNAVVPPWTEERQQQQQQQQRQQQRPPQ